MQKNTNDQAAYNVRPQSRLKKKLKSNIFPKVTGAKSGIINRVVSPSCEGGKSLTDGGPVNMMCQYL